MHTPGEATAGSRRARRPRVLAGLAVAGLTVSLIGPAPASATTASTDPSEGEHVVISEVYTTGAGADAAFNERFIELHNSGDEAVVLDGWSVSYRPASRGEENLTPSGHVTLSGTIEPGGHYLIANPGLSAGDGADLPAPDARLSGSTAIRDGVIWLSSTEERLDVPLGDVQDHEDVVDLIGYGGANTYETAAAPSPSNGSDVRSIARADEAVDTDDNSADFTLSEAITPTNSAGEQAVHEPEETERQDPRELEINEIPRSLDPAENELLEQPVTVRGVVTAAYPSGGLDGFTVQTEGTGGDLDLDAHEASDGIFVYSPWRADDVEVGDFVEVTADVTTYSGQVQLSLYPGSAQTPEHEFALIEDEPHEEVKPAVVAIPETDAERESLLGMLIDPQGTYTVTDHYTLNQFGEIGIVLGDEPLINPTSAHRPGPEADALAEENAQRIIYLDDAATTTFHRSPGWDQELPYLSADEPVRIGAEVEWHNTVVLDRRFDQWRLQPTGHLTPETADAVQPAGFEDTRAGRETPAERDGDLRIAGFNVLNYFVTLGEDEQGCEYHADRDGEPTTADWCEVRGAWSTESFERQQAKIVDAINAMDADVVALQEMENSARFTDDADRDLAHARLVEALNEDLGTQTWEFVASPEATPAPEDEDVIRNGFIYRADAVEPVGDSVILFEEGVAEIMTPELESFDLAQVYSNAREPLAQQFQPVDGDAEDGFIAIVNHFKSKGSAPDGGPNADSGDGQGAWNADRVEQARALVAFADALTEDTGTDSIFLMGDFNSYEKEDPLQEILDAGFSNISAETGQHSYMFDGQVGSLDHLFASEAAAESVSQAEIWNINAVEPIALEYSRYNGNASDLFRADLWRSSDHDPIVADLRLSGADDPEGGEDGSGDDGSAGPPRGPGNSNGQGNGPGEGRGHERVDHPGNGPGQNNGNGNGRHG
ncbi:ExeM/NucH family extracellular endonuclease [Nesterenkonia sp. CL21]|uniref:ExeM/NucH family extracellular endonuclease n=1 Tax=Nesterenkonia sp. CL21 TaxID=3064894 RepID=UPI00287B3B0D|nr:ExeM/NucH family extracellular endonuclease [Nesterenkonia sp. CL21]MDS2173682.1 ExeM/NucH family extracellular endonuclease [Nesterenkonia sp. CL21]